MTTPSSSPPRRRPALQGGGFTLAEVIAVVAIMGILAAVAIPALGSLGASRGAAAARQVARDLAYARERAQATGLRSWVVFNITESSYEVLAEPVGLPGRANAAPVDGSNPSRQRSQQLNEGPFAGVVITNVNFDGATEVGFDWLGRPLNSTQQLLALPGTITLTGDRQVTVEPGTGLVGTP